jgi:hypothetical protein
VHGGVSKDLKYCVSLHNQKTTTTAYGTKLSKQSVK